MPADRSEIIKQRAAEVNEMWRSRFPEGRDPARIDTILHLLKETWKKFPDQRLGQLFSNITGNADPFYTEDSDMARLIATYGVDITSNDGGSDAR